MLALTPGVGDGVAAAVGEGVAAGVAAGMCEGVKADSSRYPTASQGLQCRSYTRRGTKTTLLHCAYQAA